MVRLARRRDRYAAKIKQCGYPTIKAGKGTKLFERHDEAQRKLNSLRTKPTRVKLDKIIDDFHETVHTDEVDRQMRGILPSPAVLNPSTIEYELKERAIVARLLFQPLEDLKLDKMFRVRIQLVQALAQLCTRQETPHQFKKSKGMKAPTDIADALTDIDHPASLPPRLPVAATAHEVADTNCAADGLRHLLAILELYCPFTGGEMRRWARGSGNTCMLGPIAWGGTSALSTSQTGLS
jgi:hypothetical protein